VDDPHANKLTIHILAAVVEQEREAVSERTKVALAAAMRGEYQCGSISVMRVVWRASIRNTVIVTRSASFARASATVFSILRARCPPWVNSGLRPMSDLGPLLVG
jgi:hypothetical protein